MRLAKSAQIAWRVRRRPFGVLACCGCIACAHSCLLRCGIVVSVEIIIFVMQCDAGNVAMQHFGIDKRGGLLQVCAHGSRTDSIA